MYWLTVVMILSNNIEIRKQGTEYGFGPENYYDIALFFCVNLLIFLAKEFKLSSTEARER